MNPELLASGDSFAGPVDYVTLSDGSARQVKAIHRRHLFRTETAAVEMAANAAQTVYATKFAIKIAARYAPGVIVTSEQALSHAVRLLGDLGLLEHQAIIALHQKDGLYDIHIVVNNIGPKGKAARLPFALETLYSTCAKISLDNRWPISLNRYTRPLLERHRGSQPHIVKSTINTSGGRYALERGETPWSEAISYFLRACLAQSKDWDEYLTHLFHRGISIRLEGKVGHDGRQLHNLRYHLTEYPSIGSSAATVGAEFVYEALVKRLGHLDPDVLRGMPITAPKPHIPRGTYDVAGRVLEMCANEGKLGIPYDDRKLILARARMREQWLAIRAKARLAFDQLRQPAWDAESQRRADETAQRRQERDAQIKMIRDRPRGEWADMMIVLAWNVARRRRQHRKNAAARWKLKRQELQARLPDLSLTFPEFVRRRAQDDTAAALVHKDHLRRGVIAVHATTAAPPVSTLASSTARRNVAT